MEAEGLGDELGLELERVWEKVELANGHVRRSISPGTAEVRRRMVLPLESTSAVPRRRPPRLLRAREPQQFAAVWCLPSGSTSSIPRRRPPRRPSRARRRRSQGRAHDLAPRSAWWWRRSNPSSSRGAPSSSAAPSIAVGRIHFQVATAAASAHHGPPPHPSTAVRAPPTAHLARPSPGVAGIRWSSPD